MNASQKIKTLLFVLCLLLFGACSSAAPAGPGAFVDAQGDGVSFGTLNDGAGTPVDTPDQDSVSVDVSDSGAVLTDTMQGGGSTDTQTKICAPGSTQLCYCSPTAQGVQICAANGATWLPCECAPAQDTSVASDVSVDSGQSLDSADGGSTDDCEERAKQVYVLADDTTLLQFVPKSLTFKVIGKLGCSVGSSTPFSMSIDRQATAWVLYQKNSLSGGGAGLFKVSTKDASCQATGYQNNQLGYSLFGMGFSSNGIGSKQESLYIAGGSATSWISAKGNLGSIGIPSLQVTHHATLDVGGGSPELTGDGNGKLWGFFPNSNPPSVREINKSTGQTLNPVTIPAAAMQNVQSWAFARWGGRFYLFFKSQTDGSSSVFQIDENNSVTKVLSSIGYNIVGAGVSSCAPTTISDG